MTCFFKYFRQNRQNGNLVIIVNFLVDSIFVDGAYFRFSIYLEKLVIMNIMVAYKLFLHL